MASDEGRKVTLKSSDGEEFLVKETVAMESQTIRNMIEDGYADSGIPLPNVNSKILSKVIEYCKKHVESAAKSSVAAGGDEKSAEEDLKGWDSDFVKVDQATLFDLILAANYLNIKGLLDLTCQTVAYMIKGETLEVIHKPFNINQDFTLTSGEEWEFEKEIPRENHWAFDEEIRKENQLEFEEEISLRERLVLGFQFLCLSLIVLVVLTFWLAISANDL